MGVGKIVNNGPVETFFGGEVARDLKPGDPRAGLLTEYRAGHIGQKGTPSGDFFALIGKANPGFTLAKLPPDVAQAVMDSRNKSINDFLKAWADSIAEQAQLAKESGKKQDLDRLAQQQAYFAATVNKALNRGFIDGSQFDSLREKASLASAAETAVPPRSTLTTSPETAPSAPKADRPQVDLSFRIH